MCLLMLCVSFPCSCYPEQDWLLWKWTPVTSRQHSGQTARLLLSYVSFFRASRRDSAGQVTRTPSKAPSQQALCPVLVLPLLLFQHCELPQVQLGCRQAELDLCPARSREDKYTKLQAVFLDSGLSSFNFGELNLSHPGGPERM